MPLQIRKSIEQLLDEALTEIETLSVDEARGRVRARRPRCSNQNPAEGQCSVPVSVEGG